MFVHSFAASTRSSSGASFTSRRWAIRSASLMTTQRKSSTIASSIRRTLSTCSDETESVCVALSWRIAAMSRTPWIRLTIDLPTLSRRTSSLTTLASANGNSSAARSVSISILSVERISTISTPRHSSSSASGCPCVCCRQYARFRLSVHTTAGWRSQDFRSIFSDQIPQLYLDVHFLPQPLSSP